MQMEVEHRLTSLEDRTKSNTHRITEIEQRQNDLDELVSTVKVLADREERVEDDVKEIKNDVKSLTAKPGKRFDNIVDKIILTIIAAVIGFLLAQFGI